MLKLERLRLDEITPYEHNAKKHPQNQIDQIKRSIAIFGFEDPIAVDEDNIIIEGNGRYLAAQQLGMQTVPAIRLTGLTEEEKRAYILVHNKLTMNTGFNIEKLNEELRSITTIDMGKFDLQIETWKAETPEPAEDETDIQTITLTLNEEQYQLITQAMKQVEQSGVELASFGNPSKRSNLIAEVIRQWDERKTSY